MVVVVAITARHIDIKHSSVVFCRKCTRRRQKKRLSKKKTVRPSMSVYHDRRFLHFVLCVRMPWPYHNFVRKKTDDEIHRILLSKDRDVRNYRVRLFVYLSSILLSSEYLRLLYILMGCRLFHLFVLFFKQIAVHDEIA